MILRSASAAFDHDGVSTSVMQFDAEPTARADDIARYVRVWYERNRESWWLRNVSSGPGAGRPPWSDDFILALINEVERVKAEADRIAPIQRGNP